MHLIRALPVSPRQGIFILALGLLLAGMGAQSDVRADATVRVGGTGSAAPLMEALGQAYSRKAGKVRVEVVLPPMGSSAGLRAVMGGAIDLAFSAKPPAPAERDQGARHWELGRTPFLLATHEHRVDNLDSGLLADIFAGRATAWPDGTPIRLVLRPATETDTLILRGMSPTMDQAMGAALSRHGLPVATNDLENLALMEKTPGSLGMTNLALLMGTNSGLRPVSLNGVAPTLENLERGRYPHGKSLFAIRGAALSEAAQGFLDFLLSAEGRKIIAKQGYLTVKPGP